MSRHVIIFETLVMFGKGKLEQQSHFQAMQLHEGTISKSLKHSLVRRRGLVRRFTRWRHSCG